MIFKEQTTPLMLWSEDTNLKSHSRKLQEYEVRLDKLADAVGTAEGSARSAREQFESAELDHLVNVVSDAQLATARSRAEQAEERFKKAQAEHRLCGQETEKLREAIDRVRPAVMKECAANLNAAQLHDAEQVLELLEKAQALSESLEARYQESRKQYRSDDPVRASAGITVGGGVPRMVFAGIQRKTVEAYRRHVEELKEQLKVVA